MTNRTFYKTGVVLVASALSGCSWLNMGAEDYGCPGMEQGISCMSVEEAYDRSMFPDISRDKRESQADDNQKNKSEGATDRETHNKVSSGASSGVFLYSSVPVIEPQQLPAPVRTQGKVLRILIGSWVDEAGSLHLPGYIYTEIEPRKWITGEQNLMEDRVFTPLE